jgi:hypothetical protein
MSTYATTLTLANDMLRPSAPRDGDEQLNASGARGAAADAWRLLSGERTCQ